MLTRLSWSEYLGTDFSNVLVVVVESVLNYCEMIKCRSKWPEVKSTVFSGSCRASDPPENWRVLFVDGGHWQARRPATT